MCKGFFDHPGAARPSAFADGGAILATSPVQMVGISMSLSDTRTPVFPRSVERPSPRRYVRHALVIAVGWGVAAWILADRYVDWRVSAELAEAQRELSLEISDIASGIERNLSVFHGLPALVARDAAVRHALAAVRGEPTRPAAADERRAQWTRNPALAELNASLAGSSLDIRALSVLWVMDPAGDCIAASNSRAPESFVGVNYEDRAYFKSAMDGVWGQQFAVGRATGIPGMFFSAPVEDAGRVVGAVAAKVDMGYLSSWVNLANAFITDSYGVVVLAQNRAMEMRAVPWATVGQLSPGQRLDRYRQEAIGHIVLNPWEGNVPDLYRLEDGHLPVLVRSQHLLDTDLAVTVMHPVPGLVSRQSDARDYFVMTAVFGWLCVVAGSVALYHVVNRQRRRRYREYQAQLEHMASHDALTGLYSRSVIDVLIGQGVSLAARTGRSLAVLFLDMDLFKDINDSMGHESGDLVLQEVARRLRGTVRASDPVVRYGGDEFVVLLNDVDSPDTAALLAGKILDALRTPFAVHDVTLNLTASIGIALYPDDGDTASLLLRNADSALYRAKAAGRSDYRFYHASMNADTMGHLALHNELREAIDGEQFVLHFQPQYSLALRRVVGCEALVRWRHPLRGLLAPGAFIPVAEKTQLVVALGEWVLREACRQASAWRAEGLIDFPVAVNLSAVQFRKPGLVDAVERVLAESGLPPGGLELELTESVLMEESGNVMHALSAFKALGVTLSIDDFGTGYSNLAYLKRFEPDVLKIDASFVRDIETDPNDAGIVGAIVGLAKSLDYRVVAEGVEEESQWRLLETLGCHEIQGYWFSRPLPPEEFADFMRRRAWESASAVQLPVD